MTYNGVIRQAPAALPHGLLPAGRLAQQAPVHSFWAPATLRAPCSASSFHYKPFSKLYLKTMPFPERRNKAAMLRAFHKQYHALMDLSKFPSHSFLFLFLPFLFFFFFFSFFSAFFFLLVFLLLILFHFFALVLKGFLCDPCLLYFRSFCNSEKLDFRESLFFFFSLTSCSCAFSISFCHLAQRLVIVPLHFCLLSRFSSFLPQHSLLP